MTALPANMQPVHDAVIANVRARGILDVLAELQRPITPDDVARMIRDQMEMK